MSTTAILATIGGTTLILTAGARVPGALAEFLRACILVANAARELHAALTGRAPADPAQVETMSSSVHRTSDISAGDFGH